MSLSCYFSLRASGEKTGRELELLFRSIEKEARRLGFNPTLVLHARFDTAERLKFARRLTTGLIVENELLKGSVAIREEQVFSHDPINGYCRVAPEEGVILVVTDEQRTETVFGLFHFPSFLQNAGGRKVIETNAGPDWRSDDFIDWPDPRFR